MTQGLADTMSEDKPQIITKEMIIDFIDNYCEKRTTFNNKMGSILTILDFVYQINEIYFSNKIDWCEEDTQTKLAMYELIKENMVEKGFKCKEKDVLKYACFNKKFDKDFICQKKDVLKYACFNVRFNKKFDKALEYHFELEYNRVHKESLRWV